MRAAVLSPETRSLVCVGLFGVACAEEAPKVLSKGWGLHLVRELPHLQSRSVGEYEAHIALHAVWYTVC